MRSGHFGEEAVKDSCKLTCCVPSLTTKHADGNWGCELVDQIQIDVGANGRHLQKASAKYLALFFAKENHGFLY